MTWRRVRVPVSVWLHKLHGTVQAGVDWKGNHLYCFGIYAVLYGTFDLDTESPDQPDSAFRW